MRTRQRSSSSTCIFDEGALNQLYGDVEKLAASARFAGDLCRAEAQIRKLQGAFIAQGLRTEGAILGPIVLFGSLPKQHAERMVTSFGPLQIVEGLIFDAVRSALLWAAELTGQQLAVLRDSNDSQLLLSEVVE